MTTSAPAARGELDRREPDAAGSGVDEHAFARGQVPEGEERLVRGPEGDGDAGDGQEVRSRRDGPGGGRGGGDALGVRAAGNDHHHALAHAPVLHLRTDLADRPGALVPHDVRAGGGGVLAR